MEIKYLGHSSFLIKTKDARIVTDPYDSKMVGMKFPKVEADIITVSHDHNDHNQTGVVGGEPTVFNWPGQFEKKGVRIWGYKSFHDDKQGGERGEMVLYKFESEGISLLHCGDLGVVPPDNLLDEIGDVDILFVPAGDKYTLSHQDANDLIKKIEPSIVIPMHFAFEGSAIEGLTPLSEFLKKIGVNTSQPIDKLIVKKEDLEEEMKIVVLQS